MTDIHNAAGAGFDLHCGSTNENPAGLSFLALVAEDFRANESQVFHQGFWALFWHRFGNWRMGVRPKVLRMPLSLIYRIMFKVTEWLCGIHLPYNVKVGRRVRLEHFGGMILVAKSIGDDCVIRQNTTFGIKTVDAMNGIPVIGNGVDIGAGVVIIGAIRIGDNVRVGANSVVTRDVPTGATVVGVPARILRDSAI